MVAYTIIMSIRKSVDRFIRQFENDFVPQNNIELSKSAILHNLSLFQSLSGKQVIPVLKGNAYGHGISQVATALKGAHIPYIAVDGYFEALRIREISKQPVLVMGAILPINFARMKYDNFAFVVQDIATIDALGKTSKPINVHIECNTGMNRYGAKRTELADLTRRIMQYKNLRIEGVMSHLADSDGIDPTTVESAVRQFDSCVETIIDAGGTPTMFHIAQTAGSLKAMSKYANAMRLGIGLYGINPFAQSDPYHTRLNSLQPALQLTSTITKIIELEKGDKVSYNYTFTAPKAMKMGVIPFGYYEGLPRALSNAGIVKIGNHYAPIIGRICMNHTMIDVSTVNVQVGDKVVIYSRTETDKNTIDHIAHDHQLFNYNMLTALSSDVRRTLGT